MRYKTWLVFLCFKWYMIADNCIRLVRDTSYFSLDINGFGIYAWKKANIVYQLRRIKFQLICFSCIETDED